ncbi:hypothetical protein I5K45_27050 [Pseudomonas aeruginosa]|nr:hypothetical protein [Pseudomonas aeruginosa]
MGEGLGGGMLGVTLIGNGRNRPKADRQKTPIKAWAIKDWKLLTMAKSMNSPLSPDVFVMDFERTENSDELHGIFGRALIVATRFDSMCEAAAITTKIKGSLVRESVCSDIEYKDFVSKLIERHATLNSNIQSLGLPKDASEILHSAREARNYVAHELTRGKVGCLDTKVNENILICEVSELVEKIVYGDVVISILISRQSNDPLPINYSIENYKEKVIKWVTER